MSFIKIEFPEHNISISTQKTQDINLYICKITTSTQYTQLYDDVDINICLPVQNLSLRSKILSILKNKTEIIVWQYSDAALTQNKRMLMNGLITNKKINANQVNIIAYSKTWLLTQAQLPPRYKIVSTTYNALVKELLKLCKLEEIFKNIIYPTQINNIKIDARLRELSSDENGLITGYEQSIFNFLSIILNDIQVQLTTTYINNEMYLYHIDTAQIIQENLNIDNTDKVLRLFLNPQSKNHNIIDYKIDVDFTNIYDTIIASTKGNISTDTPPITTKIERSLIKQALVEEKISKSAIPPMLYTVKCKSDINKAELQDYAKYLLKKQINSSLIIEIEFVGHYPTIRNPKIGWEIGMPIKIPEKDENNNINILYNDLMTDFDLPNIEFVVAGYSMIFDIDTRKTLVTIVPSEFMEYDKTLKLMKPKII